jgi:sugar lactone lactonase YvrE
VTTLTVIADYGDLCGENPLWDHEKGVLYWTDATGARFYKYHPASGQHSLVKEGLQISGFALNKPGGFIVTTNNGIYFWDGRADLRLLVKEVDGRPCQSNDCIADPAGRLLAGTWYYEADKDYPLGHLICVETTGKVRILDDGIHLANGLGFSPDNRQLYFTDSIARRIYAYDFQNSDGSVSNRRTFVQVPDTEGLPDGLTVDAEGFVWSAQWYGSCVVRYDPDGKVERRIQTPAKQTSSLAFGGHDFTDIFITSAAKSEVTHVMPAGYDPTLGYFGGALYHLNLGIPGRAEFIARFQQ